MRKTSNRVLNLAKKHNSSLVCLVESRADEVHLNRFGTLVPKSWDWAAILADGYSGGIITLWNSRIGHVTPIAASQRALHLIISLDSINHIIISVIYNSHRFRAQCSLWQELTCISNLRFPWLVVGDFNSIVTRNEHKGGTFSYYSRKARYFHNFINNTNLVDLSFSGPVFTWCNNQHGAARRWARLDRGLVNTIWMDKFPSYSLKHLPRIFSDHAPLLLTMSSHNPNFYKVFHFENYWLDHIGCLEAVREAWSFSPNGNPMHIFSHLISRTRRNILSWKRLGLTPPSILILSTLNLLSLIWNQGRFLTLWLLRSFLDSIPGLLPFTDITLCVGHNVLIFFGCMMVIIILLSFITQSVFNLILILFLK